MDGYLAVVSKREVRRYRQTSIDEETLRRILEAGRASGSSRNRQPWRFALVTDRGRLRELSGFMHQPTNVAGCAAAVALLLTNPNARFDAGRAAQNIMLAAWSLGIGSCPNGPTDEQGAKAALGAAPELSLVTVISLGYPAPGEPRPGTRDPKGVLDRIKRVPLDELLLEQPKPKA